MAKSPSSSTLILRTGRFLAFKMLNGCCNTAKGGRLLLRRNENGYRVDKHMMYNTEVCPLTLSMSQIRSQDKTMNLEGKGIRSL